MSKATLKGFYEAITQLENLSNNVDGVLKKGLYDGAGFMVEEVKKRLNAMRIVPDIDNIKAYRTGEKYHLSVTQRRCLVESVGIAPFGKDGGKYDTHIGFDGYNDIKTKKYPNGQPNQLIARVVESGSSYMDKTPFIRQATNAGKKKAEQLMKETIENEIKKLTKE